MSRVHVGSVTSGQLSASQEAGLQPGGHRQPPQRCGHRVRRDHVPRGGRWQPRGAGPHLRGVRQGNGGKHTYTRDSCLSLDCTGERKAGDQRRTTD